ncbi:MAG: hypothetical protein KIS76_01830 [Pyrinomonadaceae bacterium]|nr:hypothetical protein [Pyrinomonadaceae bacterium]
MVSFWEDMQWQCEAGNDFYGGIVGMPFHCQMAVLRNFSGDIPWETPPAEKKESDPKKIPDHEDHGGQPSDQFSLSQAVTSAALTSTMKFTADDDISEDDEPPIDMGGAFAPRWRSACRTISKTRAGMEMAISSIYKILLATHEK